MKHLTKVRIREYLTMFGADACEAQILSEYFELGKSADTGNDTLNAVCDIARVSAYFVVGVTTAFTTNMGIAKLFEDAEEEAVEKDMLEEVEKVKNKKDKKEK